MYLGGPHHTTPLARWWLDYMCYLFMHMQLWHHRSHQRQQEWDRRNISSKLTINLRHGRLCRSRGWPSTLWYMTLHQFASCMESSIFVRHGQWACNCCFLRQSRVYIERLWCTASWDQLPSFLATELTLPVTRQIEWKGLSQTINASPINY